MNRIIECVPNFSEGQNKQVINEIAKAIGETKVNGEGVKVLHIDPGFAANRTVITFVGSPDAVCEAAFNGAKKAAELIDMRKHKGVHPRLGATDVLPLIPISGVSLEECAEMARKLAKRMFEELGIPCYCYEAAAFKPERRNLAVCRSGEYESLEEKIKDINKRPDFSPDTLTEDAAKAGGSNVGARNFLIAVNFNLNTKSVEKASEIACDVREKGRKLIENGKVVTDKDGKAIWQRGILKGCKAIGWYIEEYGLAQVSMNITDINATPLHKAYEEVCKAAQSRGLVVTGTEIIGLVPKRVLTEAGTYFLSKEKQNTEVAESELISKAINSMNLDALGAFDPNKKVIEYKMKNC